tara:strand:+ start:211 stop:903 length:693 start_codon:yes stop_codon:yes gene_type:complete
LKVFGTTKISYEIEQILHNAKHYLIIVSPYLKLNQRLKVRLSDAFKNVGDVYILYRENELKNQERIWLNSFNNVKLLSIKNLHSKIYVNEETVLISSMNLYEYSQINNHEIGVKIDNEEDASEFKDALNEIRIMIESEYTEIDHNFNEIIERTENYSMSRLFWELNENYSFRQFNKNSQRLYEYISDKSRELVDFSEDELYQDKTAVLRATELGKIRYQFLEKELKKLAN